MNRPVSQHRTLWEEGHEPGRQVVALGLALALSAVVLDQSLAGSVGVLFDVCFVLLCIATALAVRPADFFTVGVLPPMLMVVVFALLGATRPALIADPGDGVVQAVVSGLSHHAGALVTGYLICLAILAVRQRVLSQAASKRSGSPAPTRTTSG
ncbi:DUF6542 domain-containing protein [Nocardioides sp. T2.26MG-1]|uniref:DUF6542 domain-containing protein n=1 Tax=Nocardioides sp. T2.26MG-1 TaxID=3041166 RepID=UPI0024778326|nr:DUF6542 domain-containing protein [Nocardioides sp. T2.26MG-1]CAI9409824.1 hypothetical protein HIDPHFAB_01364 [Nocardioides sp. T2.26MG-1]